MRIIRTYSVAPLLPNKLKRLRDLANNLWWAWNTQAIELFRRLDTETWEDSGHNPVKLLGMIDQEKLKAAAEDEGFLSHMQRVWEDFQQYMTELRWYQKHHNDKDGVRIAYFSAEFGMTDCLPIYSGGLGVLSGDHLKSASDLGLPLVGVGLLYSHGYFRQYLNADGWQQESYPEYDYSTSPVQIHTREDGTPLTFELEMGDHKITVQVWRVQVGRITLYMLDTNVPSNRPPDRELTFRLYGGDLEMRIKQEILLGIGGVRALQALGYQPQVFHMNEGHSAFLALERIRLLMEGRGVSFDEARAATTVGNVFTTHTPVPAGNDTFPPTLIDKYFSNYYSSLGLSRKQFLGLGRQNPADDREAFCMTVLALNLAGYSNAVSRLHGRISRRMWQNVWPELPEDEIPITHITNGVHTASWTSKDMVGLLDRYLGPRWREDPADKEVWQRIRRVPDSELWRTHERRRERLVAFARRRLRQQLLRRGATKTEIEQAEEILDPEALTLGFARRFATYKRAALLLRDPERLGRILCDGKRPVQVIFAGKAHPRDTQGKDLIRQIVHLARDERFRRKIVFLEDYDINVARYMVEGADVWLNTPRRPLEASGTSGMKVICNGGLNMSIRDGWWDEAFNVDNGWAIGSGEEYDDPNYQDQVESQAVYDTLEKEVVPMFYDRGPDGLPRQWIAKMKASMASLCWYFNTHRMVREYAERFYLPACERIEQFMADSMAKAISLARWKERMRQAWPKIRIEGVESTSPEKLEVGATLQVRATVRLGQIKPEDVLVQLYTGPLDGQGKVRNAQTVEMTCSHSGADGVHLYSGTIPCRSSGMHGYALRILPRHKDLISPFQAGLIVWA